MFCRWFLSIVILTFASRTTSASFSFIQSTNYELEVGPPFKSPLDILLRLWTVKRVELIASSDIKVYWHGGTSWEPVNLEIWNRLYCRPWYDIWRFFTSDKNCTVKVPFYSKFAPFGRVTKIHVISNTKPWDLMYTITEGFDESLLTLFGVGVVLHLIAPFLGRSRTVHLSLAASLGSIVVILLILHRVMPGQRKTTLLALLMGTAAVVGTKFQEAVEEIVKQNVVYLVILGGVGAFLGFAAAYKWPLDKRSQSLLVITLRIVAFVLLCLGTTNLPFSIICFMMLMTVPFILSTCGVLLCGSSKEELGSENGNGAIDMFDHDSLPDDQKPPPFNPEYTTPRTQRPGSSRMQRPLEEPYDYVPKTPLSRSARKKYLEKHLGQQRATRFNVEGAPDYISPEQYYSEGVRTTQEELLKLKRQFREGGSWIGYLTPGAQRAVERFVAADSDDEVEDTEEPGWSGVRAPR